MRILFFLESLHSGGKERRSAELMRFLKQQPENFEIKLVLTEDEIHFDEVYQSVASVEILKRKRFRYDPSVFVRFYKICREFNPDIIHCWGKMTTFYSIPAKIACRVPLVSSLIADTSRSYSSFSPYYLLLRTNICCSDAVLSNSAAGLAAYGIRDRKARVIRNGVDLARFGKNFDVMAVRNEFGINTRFLVVMVASFTSFKDYDLLADTAFETGRLRNDVTFIAVGDGPEFERIKSRIQDEKIRNVLLAGRQKNVERIVAASDIGLLCTKKEGISNSIIEYMALGKPVIVTDTTGGSKELVKDGETGYCTERNAGKVTSLINLLLDNPSLMQCMGKKGKSRIENDFSISRMGEEFKKLYLELENKKNIEQ